MENIKELVRYGDKNKLTDTIKKELQKGTKAKFIMDKLVEGMLYVGDCFESGEAFLPDMILAAEALKEAIPLIRPYLLEQGGEIKASGKVIIATVKGDIHDIGKNLVKHMLEATGFTVIDLGVDVSSEKILIEIQNEKPDIIALYLIINRCCADEKRY